MADLPANQAETAATSNGDISHLSPELIAAQKAQQKYAEERSKRVRSEGRAQFIDTSQSEKFKQFREDPWADPKVIESSRRALSDGDHCKFLIVGAGFGGLQYAIQLIKAGFNVDDIRLVDVAGGFGGTWYWNRYPGLMCDVESYIYLPFLEETGYMPKDKYSKGYEIRDYVNLIANKWNLTDKALFSTECKHIKWDDATSEWVAEMKSNTPGQEVSTITVRSDYVFIAAGLLNHPQLPAIPGIENFKGHSFHTSRWDYKYTGGTPTDPQLTNLKDKKVGIIGTGATAIQAVPELAKWAKELYVFQRTPSSVDRRDNRPTDPEWWKREVQNKKGWQNERAENFNAFNVGADPPPPVNMIDDAWTKMPAYRALVGAPGIVSPENVMELIGKLHAMDLPRAEKVRARIEEIVKDKDTAEALKPWYPGWCKRPCFHDDYLPSFNQSNVKLVDTNGKGVDRLTETGAVVNGTEYPFDLLIFSTGFRTPVTGTPAGRANMTLAGRKGLTMDEKFGNGIGTLHGVISRDFPNLFFPGPVQVGVSANFSYTLEQLSKHAVYIIAEAERKAASSSGKKVIIEPTTEAEQAYAMQIMMRAAALAGMNGCTPGYLNAEGELDKLRDAPREVQMKAAAGSPWGEGAQSYVDFLRAWRNEGQLAGVEIQVA